MRVTLRDVPLGAMLWNAFMHAQIYRYVSGSGVPYHFCHLTIPEGPIAVEFHNDRACTSTSITGMPRAVD